MLTIISLGAGVQSSTLALMAAAGEIRPMPNCGIFADTQSEPMAVYTHLAWLESVLPFPVYRVTMGSLREEIMRGMSGEQRINGRPPFFVESGGMLRRQCTQDYKLVPIHRKIRELAGVRPRSRGPKCPIVTQWIGITTDEAHRMKPSRVRWIAHEWPLIDAGLSRQGCLWWLSRNGFPIPSRSACTFCPYHNDAEWYRLKMGAPEDFAGAVQLDQAIRPGIPGPHNQHAQWYVHRSLRPLAEVEFDRTDGQLSMFGDECEGLCGV